MTVISLFSGCGGQDLGFTNAGFKLVYANDNSKMVRETFEKNHGIRIDKRSITTVPSTEIPPATGIIGGPPCQSWSLAARNRMKGITGTRGQLFYEYIRIIRDKKPAFFVAENVPGIVSRAHVSEFSKIIKQFEKLGYAIFYYNKVDDGYKMVGNAVPVKLAEVVAKKIKNDLLESKSTGYRSTGNRSQCFFHA